MRKLRNTILLAVLTVTMFSLCSCSTYDNFVHQFFHKAGATDETIKIGQKASIKKISVDILGKKGGVITKYGEPLSLLPEKN